MQNRRINPETIPAPIGLYTHAMEVGPNSRWLVASGQIGIDAAGKVPEGIAAQAEIVWTNLIRILEANTMRMSDVVKINHFLTRREDLAGYNAVRNKYLGDNRPASTLLIVVGLARPEFLVEVEIVAARAVE
ncbi:MAG: RidA family protein [Alphaproteobacteria bacterium]|nr:RidA family protein [Alphaproteobacteria bacterium]